MPEETIHNIREPMSLSIFGGMLRAARESRKMTLDALAKETGISKPYLSQIETARTPGPPSVQKLRRIAGALHIGAADLLAGADWLRAPASIRKALRAVRQEHRQRGGPAGGEARGPDVGEEARDESAAPRRADGAINLDEWMGTLPESSRSPLPRRATISPAGEEMRLVPVPVINRVAAGAAAEFTDLDYPAGIADQYVPAPDLPEAPLGAAFAVRIRGDSMMPEYREGEIVIVGPAPPEGPRDGDDCVVRLGELDQFATTFKRIFLERDEAGEAAAVRLVPLNPAHRERRVPMEQVTGIYPVVYRLIPARPHGRPPAAQPPK